jgi:hypothetical protein
MGKTRHNVSFKRVFSSLLIIILLSIYGGCQKDSKMVQNGDKPYIIVREKYQNILILKSEYFVSAMGDGYTPLKSKISGWIIGKYIYKDDGSLCPVIVCGIGGIPLETNENLTIIVPPVIDEKSGSSLSVDAIDIIVYCEDNDVAVLIQADFKKKVVQILNKMYEYSKTYRKGE